MQWTDLLPAIKHLSEADRARVHDAFEMCLRAHQGQTRKSGEPFATHPIAVAHILAEMGADADTLIAALLHDVIEDTTVTRDVIEGHFGPVVAALVDAVTKLDDEEIRAHPTLDEETESLRKMITTMEQDVRLMIIKLADRLHNMRTVASLSAERRTSYARETLDIYVKIADRLSMQDFRDELEALCIAVLEPEFFPKLQALRTQNAQKGPQVAQEVHQALIAADLRLPPTLQVRWEPKTWDHLRDRVERDDTVASKRTAVTLAFVVDQVQDCYLVLGGIHQLWNFKILSFKDFINTPADNGYRGIHTTIILKNGMQIRCKIRTTEMQLYARKGITAHCFEQKNRGLFQILPWLQHVHPLSQDTENHSKNFLQNLQNDLLGKSITIYGPHGIVKQLPRGSSVLDGAFFLFGHQTLFQTAIRVNGEKAPLFTTLDHSASLILETGAEKTVSHEWLSWVNTGFSTAQIRAALSDHSEEEKRAMGRSLLERAMQRESRGLLAEFKEAGLLEGFKKLGFASVDKAYAAIADGHLDPSVAIATIFDRKRKDNSPNTATKRRCTVRFTIPVLSMEAISAPFRFLEQKYGISLGDIRLISPTNRKEGRISIRIPLDGEGQETIVQELQAVGMQDVTVEVGAHSKLLSSGILFLTLVLWGLDPVFARMMIIGEDITPIDFTLLRFWTLAVAFTIATLIRRRHALTQPLNFLHPLLWASSILMVLVALTTYELLHTCLATHYEIIMTGSGLIAATAFGTLTWKRGTFLWIIFTCIVGLLTLMPTWTMQYSLVSALALGSFAAFMLVSNRYMREMMVSRRMMEYYSLMLIIGCACTIPLFSFASPLVFHPWIILQIALFSFAFIGLPYYLYYSLLPKWKVRSIIPYSFIMLGATFLGEYAFTGVTDLPTIGACLLMIILTLLLPTGQRPNQRGATK